VVFFEDDDLRAFANPPSTNTPHPAPDSIETLYQRTIAEKFEYEKRLIVSTLQQNGIYALLTSPSRLSIAVINKYLELKSRNVL